MRRNQIDESREQQLQNQGEGDGRTPQRHRPGFQPPSLSQAQLHRPTPPIEQAHMPVEAPEADTICKVCGASCSTLCRFCGDKICGPGCFQEHRATNCPGNQ